MVTNEIVVTEATFQIDHLEVVGDAGVDARTTHSRYLVAWDSSRKPGKESFPQAPVGVYSKVNLVMAVGNLSENLYEIRGTWTDSGASPRPFRIRDRGMQLPVSVDCNETLPAAGSASMALKIDLRDALSGVNWKLLAEEDEIDLREGPQLNMFRTRLRTAFEIDEAEDD